MQSQWSDEQVLSHLSGKGAPHIGEGNEARVFDIGGGRVLKSPSRMEERSVSTGPRCQLRHRDATVTQ